jgi:hypothetical protein
VIVVLALILLFFIGVWKMFEGNSEKMQSYDVGSLRLMDLEKAFFTLMCKLMLMAMEPCESNLKTLLKFNLVNYKPS